MKRRLATILALLMIVSTFPMAVFAEADAPAVTNELQKARMINVTVNFVDDATGRDIKPAEVIQIDGDDYTLIYPLVENREALQGWICINPHIMIGKVYEDTEVTFRFDRVFTAEFRFEDEEGNTLKEAEIVSTGLGELVDISRKTAVKGYTLLNPEDARIANIDKDYTGDNAKVLVYKMNPDAVFDITVHFVDEDGNTIKDDYTAQVKGGDPFSETFSIEGYEGEYELDLDKVIGDVETTFIFSKATYTVTIAYVDKDGNQLAPSKDVTVEYGQDISVDNPVIKGYKTDSAKFEMQNVTSNDYVEVVYTKLGGDQPDTGDNSPLVMMLGLLFASCAGIFGIRRKLSR